MFVFGLLYGCEAFVGFFEDVFYVDEAVTDGGLGDAEDDLFGFFEEVFDFFGFGEAETFDGVTGLDEVAEGGFLFDDLGVL